MLNTATVPTTRVTESGERIRFVSISGIYTPTQNSTTIKLVDSGQSVIADSNEGTGAIDGIAHAIRGLYGRFEVMQCCIISLGVGTRKFRARIEIMRGGYSESGEAEAHGDIAAITAALVCAINKLLAFEAKSNAA